MLPPTIAAEVISEGNTKGEMKRKIREYFDSRSRLVWMIYPKTRTIAIYDHPSDEPLKVLTESEILDGGEVLPGFGVPVADIFNKSV
jgi:Uma2 family endonuclease